MSKKLILILAAVFAASARRLHNNEAPLHQYNDEYYPTHASNEEQQHLLGTGMQSVFNALKDDPVASKYINNPPKDEASYNQLQTSIVNTVKNNEQIQTQLADNMFGSGQIGALFTPEQRIKLLNYVIDNSDIIKGEKDSAKSQLIEFIKSDSELSAIYNQNQNLFTAGAAPAASQ